MQRRGATPGRQQSREPHRLFWAALAAPGIIWLALLFIVPFYAILAIAAGQVPVLPAELERDVPADLRDAAEAVERARGAAIYTVLKAARRYMMRLEEEQEFLASTADMMMSWITRTSVIPTNLPRMNSCRCSGFGMMVKTVFLSSSL